MKIAPLKVSDPWYGRIVNDDQTAVESLQGVPIESIVQMELVELLHSGPEDNYRPYLHMRGELTEATPVVELPYGVTELAMRRGAGLNVDAFYDFNTRQLGELVEKGYFTEGFQVPSEMSGIPWTLPGRADFLIVPPVYSDQPPVVFMSMHDQSELELDQANSGYDLSAYFPDYTAESQPVKATAVVQSGRFDSDLDVFSDLTFEDRQPEDAPASVRAERSSDQRADVPTRIFSRLVSEIEAQQGPSHTVIVPGSPVDVYHSRVSPAVDQVLSAEQIEAEIDAVAAERAADADAAAAESDPVPMPDSAKAPGETFLDLNEPEDTADADSARETAENRDARVADDDTGAPEDEVHHGQ
jgi:hypothetical protein